jgi:hypothetical protein
MSLLHAKKESKKKLRIFERFTRPILQNLKTIIKLRFHHPTSKARNAAVLIKL